MRLIIEMAKRAAFIDFCQGCLNLDPSVRWTPQQARMHPLITGEMFTKPLAVSQMKMIIYMLSLIIASRPIALLKLPNTIPPPPVP